MQTGFIRQLEILKEKGVKKLLVIPAFVLSFMASAEIVELNGGKQIEIHDDGTWTSIEASESSAPVEVDFFDFVIDPDAYIGQTIAIRGLVSWDIFKEKQQAYGKMYVKHVAIGEAIAIEASFEQLTSESKKEIYRCDSKVFCVETIVGIVESTKRNIYSNPETGLRLTGFRNL